MSYKKSEIVYDATVHFCRKRFKPGDRTIDQMVQAARSGKQNIAEASVASATSKEMEIKLTQVARASLEELLIDYQDFLRTRGLPEWPRDHPGVLKLRENNARSNRGYEDFCKGIEHENPEISANIILGLIRLTSYLLDRQVERLEQDFIREGGLRERMSQVRRSVKGEKEGTKKT